MMNRWAFEALDRSLRDIMSNDIPFGNKIIICGGDFRQILPVIKKGMSNFKIPSIECFTKLFIS